MLRQNDGLIIVAYFHLCACHTLIMWYEYVLLQINSQINAFFIIFSQRFSTSQCHVAYFNTGGLRSIP